MNISLNWLKKYIDLDMDPDKISEILTTIGLEVEGMEEVESIKGGLKGVVVGHVVECGKHPNADKLSLTKVNVGSADLIQVVCGAPNVAAGQKVLVATVGTTLYDKDGAPWKIKKGKIRGEESQGMICAEDELGLGNSHDGIMVLDEDAEVGSEAAQLFNLENDIVFDIGLTPNRSDATSHLGVARDLAAYLSVNEGGSGLVNIPDLSTFKVDNNTNPFKVEIEDVNLCPRYTGISISGVTIKESPDWIKNHLRSVGIRPISNIVDITNFILLEYGQPLHAFDADRVKENTIIVKTLPTDTVFKSLDEQERKLSDQDLMICDGKSNGMCIAGVFGGLDSGVTDSTQNIFLESAHFNAGNIRRTSTRHLLRTDAAKCFEKGSDPNITEEALKRAAILIQELAGGMITSEIVDVYPEKIEPVEIHLRYDNVNRIIGNDISVEEIHQILRAMNMEIKPLDDKSIKVSVPTDKADVLREIDLIEEVLRIYGFNKITTPSKVLSTLSFTQHPDKNAIKRRINAYLTSIGFNEMMNLSLIESRHYAKALPMEEENFIFINNTSNIHLDIMRPEMLLSGLQSVAYNLNRQQNDIKVFEIGKSYSKVGEEMIEKEKLTLYISGNSSSETWKNKDQSKSDFFDLKSVVNSVLDLINVQGYQQSASEDARLSSGFKYHRGPNVIVDFGKVNKTILKGMDIKQEVYFAEFDIQVLINGIASSTKIKPISKFPSSRRDLALVVNKNVKFEDIVKIARKVDKKILKDIGLFDVYEDEKRLGEGKKSYAVSFTFENMERTLNDKELEKVMQKLENQFSTQLEASIRR